MIDNALNLTNGLDKEPGRRVKIENSENLCAENEREDQMAEGAAWIMHQTEMALRATTHGKKMH